MERRKDYLAIITMILMLITGVAGIMSIDFTRSYEVVNQYGHTVQMYGYGIYAYDTFFSAPISIGTDFCIVFAVFPLFLFTYISYRKKGSETTRLKLISVYAVVLYYAASLSFGVTYNRLFLGYVALFACSLFGMFAQISCRKPVTAVTATKGVSVFLILSGIALIVAWFPDLLPSLINGGTLSLIGVYTTNITYVLDMGIISPICFITLFLLKKRNAMGTLLLAVMLKLCIIVGIMMIPQTICQMLSGCDIPIPALVTKSLSFVVLGGFAYYFNRKLYAEIKEN